MKIFVTGTRGIPDIPGGVEKHCQELFQRIAARGHDVLIATRSPYVMQKIDNWQGIKLVACFAPKRKSFEAIIHTLIALLKARWHSPDLIHIHAIGPSLLTPLARLLGLKVVVTNHGPDYDRQKWGRMAKSVLRLGEKMGGVYANQVIVISSVIGKTIRERCRRDTNLIYNGVALPQVSKRTDFLKDVGIKPGRYILAVARFVPEKGLHDLMSAFKAIESDHKLVIAGGADHESNYSRNLRKMAAADKRVVLTGYITGEPLHQIYSHARLFVLPSYHEGLPIALLEAMSYGLSLLVSDIPANKEVGLSSYQYFSCGDVNDLREKMENLLQTEWAEHKRKETRDIVAAKYDWSRIADQTINVYEKVLNKHS